MIARRSPRPLLALTCALAAIGCSHRYDDLPREPVAGTVTMDGKPLPEAVIQFTPAGDAGKAPVVGGNAEIKEGQFAIPREDGLVPGKYKVSISHAEMKDFVPKARKSSAPAAPPSSIPSRTKKTGPETIPARYNTRTELTTEIMPGGASDLKYELQSK